MGELHKVSAKKNKTKKKNNKKKKKTLYGKTLNNGETTRGLNDAGRKGKWAKRLRGERESGRNDPDSMAQYYYVE